MTKTPTTLQVATYNIHKGFSHFNRRLTVYELRDQLRTIGADVVFLQEVVGYSARHALRHKNWPTAPQHEFLADSIWSDFAYGRNAVSDQSHHGNAILSRYPIVRFDNEDISTNSVEDRGLLHAEIEVPGWPQRLHCVCAHLGLTARGRRIQMQAVCERIEALVPMDAPLILAGDFNDWRAKASDPLGHLGVVEVFEITQGRPARSFPARLPLLRLDRIYIRGFNVKHAHVHVGAGWLRVSDHVALTANLTPV
ncbi:MAG: endonuclease/exonuclease/phosphatase family protein [Burkholderiales bacterium]|nr:endonuclease/exonuclease/phosphatase family protein [Burkholderiales bacterium]